VPSYEKTSRRNSLTHKQLQLFNTP